jgi:two-component system cell cycle sensor histidine kinase/response regulator CckA
VSIKTRVVPATVCLLAVLAIGGVVLLERQASANHDAQVKVLAYVSELNGLQQLPWLFDSSATVAHGELTAGEAQISTGLDKLQQREPNGDLQAARPMLAANFAALGRIYSYSTSTKAGLAGAKTLALGQVDSLEAATDQLAEAGREYSRAAYWGQVEAVAAAAAAIMLLLAAFGFFYRRSGRTLRQLAAIVDSSDDAIASLTLDGTIQSWNAGAERMYGYTADEIIGLPVSILMPARRHNELPEYLDRLRRGGRGEQFDTTRLHRDGHEVEVAITVAPIKDATGAIIGVAAVARDITEQNRAATALRRSEENYRMLFERHPSPLFVSDPETQAILAVNEMAIATYGYSREEFLTMTVDDLRLPEDGQALKRMIADSTSQRIDAGVWRNRKKDGAVIDVAVVVSPIEFQGRPALVALAQDVSKQRRLEEQLRQVQKMEAIGSLAGGIAHDFNNILMVIRGYSSILLKNLTDEKQEHQVLQIDQAAERAAELTHQMLAFSRQQVLKPEVTDVNAVVVDALVLLERVLGEDITLECELDPGLGSVLVDRGQLSQVILNLAGNARDAMHDGGMLNIRTSNVELTEDAIPGDVAPGKYILLRVADSGAGMDADTQARVFDPFFTTKAQGTGLGLATVYGIVKQSGGHVSISSEPGRGTTLEVYFPRVDARVAASGAPDAPGMLDGNETILVVEDTDTVRALVAETIESYGYTVLQASRGAEAIEIAAEHAGAIDLLLTDVVMPEMNGRELAELLVAEYPDLRVLFTSGYPADAVLRRGIAMAEAAFIEKPYPMEALAIKVREVLDAPATQHALAPALRDVLS